mmetsp:Transcript_13945/g.27635  ORF Transcript_13945/g.27635 Transcript_13945/m.27635 type:complete len:312 (-) Transcript_13945:341-1276(-)
MPPPRISFALSLSLPLSRDGSCEASRRGRSAPRQTALRSQVSPSRSRPPSPPPREAAEGREEAEAVEGRHRGSEETLKAPKIRRQATLQPVFLSLLLLHVVVRVVVGVGGVDGSGLGCLVGGDCLLLLLLLLVVVFVAAAVAAEDPHACSEPRKQLLLPALVDDARAHLHRSLHKQRLCIEHRVRPPLLRGEGNDEEHSETTTRRHPILPCLERGRRLVFPCFLFEISANLLHPNHATVTPLLLLRAVAWTHIGGSTRSVGRVEIAFVVQAHDVTSVAHAYPFTAMIVQHIVVSNLIGKNWDLERSHLDEV